MENILFINACVRPESRTYRLAQEVLKKLNGKKEEVCLFQKNIPALDLELLEKRNRLLQERNFSDPMFRYAGQFAAADDIVIAAPYWDLAFPSVLRIYLEHVTVTGVTFQYTPEGIPEGLCRAKRIIYVTTAGGSVGNQNLGYDYVKSLAGTFYGIPDVLCFKAENLDIVGADVDGILQDAVRDIRLASL